MKSNMSNIINVTPKDDYSLLIEFEHGNKIIFSMQRLIKTLPYSSLNDFERFKDIKFMDKVIFWQGISNSNSTMPHLRLTVDNILFTIRD